MCSQLTSYLITNQILSPSQYAYRPSHSTEDAVLDIVEWAARSVDVGEVASLTSIDLSKAFDSIDHQLLLNKLSWCGISSPWFSSYLSGRSQLICGGSTAALPLSHGVPQGSIAGPILFLIFVNDLSCFLRHGRLVSYADDTQILDSAPSNPCDLQVLKSRAQENIKCLQHWCSLNSLKMNADITCFTLLGTQNSIDRASGFAVKVNDVDIRPAKHIKVLGVLLDQTLSWETHISSIVRRTNATLVSLFKIRHHLSPEILTILVQAHVFPHLQYCSSVWGGATNSRLDRLQKVIHFAARLVSGLSKYRVFHNERYFGNNYISGHMYYTCNIYAKIKQQNIRVYVHITCTWMLLTDFPLCRLSFGHRFRPSGGGAAPRASHRSGRGFQQTSPL